MADEVDDHSMAAEPRNYLNVRLFAGYYKSTLL